MFWKAHVQSFRGIRGVSVRVCSPPGDPSSKNIHKREKVSYTSNLLYSDFRIRTWKAYDIGPGKLIPWTKFDVPKESELPTMEVRPSTDLKASTKLLTCVSQTNQWPASSERQTKASTVIPCPLSTVPDYLRARIRGVRLDV